MQKPPWGVAILAATLFVVSPIFVAAGVKAFIREIKRPPQLAGAEILLAVGACAVIVGMVCAVAAADLWRLRQGGRPVAIFLMCMFGVFASDMAFIAWTDAGMRSGFWPALAASLFCLWAVVYLCLPKIRRKFAAVAPCKL
jgi:hypothetical protein